MYRKYLIYLKVIFLSSCGYYAEHKEGSAVVVKTGAVDFATVKNQVFDPHCVRCHQQYASFSGAKREATAALAAVNAGRMPKGGGALPENLKQILRDWVAAGAPENTLNSPGQPSPVELEANWKSVSENIFLPFCLVCHNPEGQAKFLDLSSRQAIFAARNRRFGAGEGKALLNFELPAESYLLDVLADDEEPMPPVWSNIRRLNPEEVSVLQQWIGLGLP